MSKAFLAMTALFLSVVAWGQSPRPDIDEQRFARIRSLSATIRLPNRESAAHLTEAATAGSLDLLGPHLPKIYEMLATSKFDQFAVVVLDRLQPCPPEAVRIVADYMGRYGPNDPVQPWAAQFVIGNAHGDDRILDVITNLASQRLDQRLRLRLLDLTAYFFKGNERLLGMMGASLNDPDPVIRARAAHDLSRLEKEYLSRYKLDLERMAADSSEAKEVKGAADLALRVLAGSYPAPLN